MDYFSMAKKKLTEEDIKEMAEKLATDMPGFFGPPTEESEEFDKERKKTTAKLIKSLTAYIDKHPDQRFWQALKNWSGADRIDYAHEYSRYDTYNWEEKTEIPD